MGLLRKLSGKDKKSKKDKKNKSPAPKKNYNFYKIDDNYKTYEELQDGLRKKGLEASQLMLGIDYTKSNEWTGERTFNNLCLHDLSTGNNPYQHAIEIIGRTLEPFDDDNEIPVFGFGDQTTTDKGVFPFYPDERYCKGFKEVLGRYNEITPYVKLNGPTNFAPLIYKAIQVVKETGEYHILVIIADGQVNKPKETAQAIVHASNYPISIIMIGVGDGPWAEMEKYDDELPQRKFDNFQFVNFHGIMTKKNVENHDIEFAMHAMMEIPEQYHAIKELGLLDKVSTTATADKGKSRDSMYPELKHYQSFQPSSLPYSYNSHNPSSHPSAPL